MKHILMSRRLNFLHYMLHEDENSLIHQFLITQAENPNKSDWIFTVTNDLENLEINLSFEDIKNTSKSVFKQLVKERVKSKAFQYLVNLQQTHSKSRDIKYTDFQLQDYLKPTNNMTIKEKSFIFSVRSRMLDIKGNFKIGKSDLKCRKCGIEEELQKHLLFCPKLCDYSLMKYNTILYEDLLGVDSIKIETIGKILMKRFNLLLSDNHDITPLCTDNSSCAASIPVEELE